MNDRSGLLGPRDIGEKSSPEVRLVDVVRASVENPKPTFPLEALEK